MSDALWRLGARAVGATQPLRPVVPALFEPRHTLTVDEDALTPVEPPAAGVAEPLPSHATPPALPAPAPAPAATAPRPLVPQASAMPPAPSPVLPWQARPAVPATDRGERSGTQPPPPPETQRVPSAEAPQPEEPDPPRRTRPAPPPSPAEVREPRGASDDARQAAVTVQTTVARAAGEAHPAAGSREVPGFDGSRLQASVMAAVEQQLRALRASAGADPRAAATEAVEVPDVIRVTIGRVDVRAAPPPPVPPRAQPPREQPAALSLADYLARPPRPDRP